MTSLADFLAANVWGLVVLVGGAAITAWGFLLYKGHTPAQADDDDGDGPDTNPKGKL